MLHTPNLVSLSLSLSLSVSVSLSPMPFILRVPLDSAGAGPWKALMTLTKSPGQSLLHLRSQGQLQQDAVDQK